MLSTTDAIVLSLQPHSDKAHVLHAYTRAYGRVNYMVYGMGRKNTSGRYTPLSLLQLTTDNRSIRTEQLSFVPRTIDTDPYKRTIVLFISEVLYHILRHPMADEPMYDYISEAVQALDATDKPQNFHLLFLVGLASRLGFAIDSANPLSLITEGVLPLTREERQKQLRALCNYFAEHVETWQEPKSLEILMEVFD
jgi:DNA repair protein RecO (recombination protein O)